MKYEVRMSCGHTQTVDLIGTGKERERKIAFYESSGLCRECYKRKMQERDKTDGLNFNASVLPHVDIETGKIQLFVWFSGNTMPAKESIKSLGGYRWTKREAADDWYSASRPQMCWGKIIDADCLPDEVEKAAAIGAESLVPDSGLFAMAHYEIAKQSVKEWQERHERIAAVPKPAVPEILKGHKWNKKIYGKAGNYSIYPDGEKLSITDEQADDIRKYLAEKEEYLKIIKELN